MALLTARNLNVTYPGGKRVVLADLSVDPGQVVPLIGKSGSGKSTFAKLALGLLPPGTTYDGSLSVEGRVGWIPQDVADAFSPFHRMAVQLCDGAQHHLGLSFGEAAHVAALMLDQLGVDPARMHDHPHRWSGGMLQRALVVMALIAQPRIVIADEPTASLDAASARRVLSLLDDYASRGNGVVLIHHESFGTPHHPASQHERG